MYRSTYLRTQTEQARFFSALGEYRLYQSSGGEVIRELYWKAAAIGYWHVNALRIMRECNGSKREKHERQPGFVKGIDGEDDAERMKKKARERNGK